MSYTEQTWANGDIITAEKLNHMEDGIAGGGAMIVNATYDEQLDTDVLDKTAQEIYDAMASGIPVFVKHSEGTTADTEFLMSLAPIVDIHGNNGNIDFIVPEAIVTESSTAIEPVFYAATSMSDYPVRED